MCMDFHDLVNSERELEEKGEKLLEKKSEVESRIDLLEKAVQKLSDDIQISGVLQNREQQTKEESDKIAREIISLAIQRCAADHVSVQVWKYPIA